jgi:hypothetical protein
MTRVDPDDDSIDRWVAFHYRYDHDRRERRNVILAAFDNTAELDALLHQQGAELQAAKERGEAEDVEHLGGWRYAAGYLAEVVKTRQYPKPPKSPRMRKNRRQQST